MEQQGAVMKSILRTKLMGGALVLAGALLTYPATAVAQDYGAAGGYNAPAGQLDSLVSRIALYPDPLLAQIFAAAAYPDQIAAAAQGSGGPFDPSIEALMQYPSVLQMMASDPSWTQALGQAMMQDQAAVMDTIQNLRREAQQYGYLQSGPQMQVVDDGGYIDIEPVGGYVYVPIYDPHVVFARPRPGFFLSGAIRFGSGFHWAGGYNRFNWRSHEVMVNRRVWMPPVRRVYEQPQRRFEPRRFEDNRRNFTGGNHEWNRNYTAPAMQPQAQRNSAPEQPRRDFGRQVEQRNFTAPQQRSFTPAPRPMEQRNLTVPRQMEQRRFAPQPRNQGERFHRGGEGRSRGR
jgi:hypothetical protein